MTNPIIPTDVSFAQTISTKEIKMKNLSFSILVLALSVTATQAQQKMGDMAGMDVAAKPTANSQMNHMAKGIVKKVDAKACVVTLAHEPVKSLGWPAMTMGFKLADKMLFDKLAEGAKIELSSNKSAKTMSSARSGKVPGGHMGTRYFETGTLYAQ